MFKNKCSIALFSKLFYNTIPRVPNRKFQVTVVGAANDIGSNVALLLKQNSKLRRLKLYDDDDKVHGYSLELSFIPGGPVVDAYSGHSYQGDAIADSNLIVMVTRTPRKPTALRDQMLIANAPAVQNLCKTMVERNPNAFLAISTSPLNSVIPFASSVLYKYNSYNPFRVFGITHIDVARAKTFAARALKTNPGNLEIPVIGGHSEETVVPLFSNLSPSCYNIDQSQANILTRMVKKAGAEVVTSKFGAGSASLAMAWSINEFVEGIINALSGSPVELNCYTANPNFGTRFFAGPNIVGPYGLLQTCNNFQMNQKECSVLADALHAINRDIALGEDYARIFA